MKTNKFIKILLSGSILITSLSLNAATIQSAQSGDWNNTSTWVGGVVPTSADEVDINNGHTVNVTSSVGAAVVEVKVSGTLVINSFGTLDISGNDFWGLKNDGTTDNFGELVVNNSSTYGVYTQGTFNNSGVINIGNNALVGAYGLFIVNFSGFPGIMNNLPTGTINIDRATSNGINFLGDNAVFTNDGLVNIGSITGAPTIPRGINYEYQYTCTLVNTSSGVINVDNTSDSGIKIWDGQVTNQGTINIGANGSAGTYGIISYGAITNSFGAVMNIDNVTRGIYFITGSGSNDGSIFIGANSSLNELGLYTQVTFDNSGTLICDNVTTGVSVTNGVCNNTGTVTVGPSGPVVNLTFGGSPFNNEIGGVLNGTGAISPSGYVDNGGTLSPGYSPGSHTFNSSEDLSNGILELEVNGNANAGVDFDQVVVSGTVTLGGTLNVSINYNPTNGDLINILSASNRTGTFSVVSALPPDWSVVYDLPTNGDVSLEFTGCTDSDGDGVCDTDDSDPFNEFVCSDLDNDTCDDCSSGTFDPANDGTDTDGDGLCDTGDPDDDNDGVLDLDDSDMLDPFICSDVDGDTCDDCSSGTFDPANDGVDTDGDGLCDIGDLCNDASVSLPYVVEDMLPINFQNNTNYVNLSDGQDVALLEGAIYNLYDSNGNLIIANISALPASLLVGETYTLIINKACGSTTDVEFQVIQGPAFCD